jgi:hypothetical protein
MSGENLQAVVDALGQHEVNRYAGELGDRIEVRCPNCDWHAWSYAAYASGPVAEAAAWLLDQHDCAAC